MKQLLAVLVLLFGCEAKEVKDISHELEPSMNLINDGMSREVKVEGKFTVPYEIVNDCSGVIFSDNLVLTMNHCVAGEMSVDGNPAFLLKKDEKKDLALLYTFTGRDPEKPQVLLNYWPLQINSHPQIADKIFMVGLPAMKPVVEIGRVIGWDEKFLWIDVRAGHGASGGGVYDMEGRLVGLVRGFESDGLPIFTHVVKGEDIRAFLQK